MFFDKRAVNRLKKTTNFFQSFFSTQIQTLKLSKKQATIINNYNNNNIGKTSLEDFLNTKRSH